MKTNVKQRKALWESGYVTPSLFGVHADNITPMTVVGTNTFIVHAPGSRNALVVDPGPPDVKHLQAVLKAVEDRGAQVAGILVTHHHIDHIAGTDLFRYMLEHGSDSVDPNNVPAELSGERFKFDTMGHYPVVAFPDGGVPVYHSELGNLPEGPFAPFEGCPRMEIVALPGHSYEMVGLILNDDKIILTGDLIFRYWSTVIPYGEAYTATSKTPCCFAHRWQAPSPSWNTSPNSAAWNSPSTLRSSTAASPTSLKRNPGGSGTADPGGVGQPTPQRRPITSGVGCPTWSPQKKPEPHWPRLFAYAFPAVTGR